MQCQEIILGKFRFVSVNKSYFLHTGDAGDSLSYHNEVMFSTNDRDNDKWLGNCAQWCAGAWWYNGCLQSNLNGHYRAGSYDDPDKRATGVNWQTWKGYYYSLKKTEIKFRPAGFQT